MSLNRNDLDIKKKQQKKGNLDEMTVDLQTLGKAISTINWDLREKTIIYYGVCVGFKDSVSPQLFINSITSLTALLSKPAFLTVKLKVALYYNKNDFNKVEAWKKAAEKTLETLNKNKQLIELSEFRKTSEWHYSKEKIDSFFETHGAQIISEQDPSKQITFNTCKNEDAVSFLKRTKGEGNYSDTDIEESKADLIHEIADVYAQTRLQNEYVVVLAAHRPSQTEKNLLLKHGDMVGLDPQKETIRWATFSTLPIKKAKTMIESSVSSISPESSRAGSLTLSESLEGEFMPKCMAGHELAAVSSPVNIVSNEMRQERRKSGEKRISPPSTPEEILETVGDVSLHMINRGGNSEVVADFAANFLIKLQEKTQNQINILPSEKVYSQSNPAVLFNAGSPPKPMPAALAPPTSPPPAIKVGPVSFSK